MDISFFVKLTFAFVAENSEVKDLGICISRSFILLRFRGDIYNSFSVFVPIMEPVTIILESKKSL
jgi:hypothetical protein